MTGWDRSRERLIVPQDEPAPTLECWAILELMGHRRLAGYISEQTIAGAAFIRIDAPADAAGEPSSVTQFYSAAAVYAITPTTEAIARELARDIHPEPVHAFELRHLLPAPEPARGRRVDGDFDDIDALHTVRIATDGA